MIMCSVVNAQGGTAGLSGGKFWGLLSLCVVVYAALQLWKGLEASVQLSDLWETQVRLSEGLEFKDGVSHSGGRLVHLVQAFSEGHGNSKDVSCISGVQYSCKSYNASEVNRFLTARSRLKGYQHKKGVLDPTVWMLKYGHERREAGFRWLADSLPTFNEAGKVNEE